MAYENVKIREIVDRCVNHGWSIPEFQRGFVWKATQVRDLAESLWLNYPIGSLLAWNSPGPVEERYATDKQRPNLWLVDGQQRATALSVLFGRKPYWLDTDLWEDLLKKYDIRFDIHTKEPPYFWVANAIICKDKTLRYIPLSELLRLDTSRDKDQQTLQNLAEQIKLQGLCDQMNAMQVFVQLDRIRQIRDLDLVTVSIDHDLEDVVEIFARLNSRGTRVTEADIYLGVVAARNPGWVKGTFLRYLQSLADAGFDLNPNLLFRATIGVGAKKVLFKEIPSGFWEKDSIEPAWRRTTKALEHLIAHFMEYGILSNDPMPTETALVTMVALIDKFPTEPFGPSLYWFLQASRFSRYSGSSATALSEDLRDIGESGTYSMALSKLLTRLPELKPLTLEDFRRDYADSRFGRFLLYLLAYKNGARDWDERSHRLGFDGLEILKGFKPQWHHIFPKKFLFGKVDDEKIDSLANIAVIGQPINNRIHAKDPMDYFQRFGITEDKLQQQYIEKDVMTTSITDFERWLERRAQRLADVGNSFLDSLKCGVID